jgi:excisionase family DNA binding protein
MSTHNVADYPAGRTLLTVDAAAAQLVVSRRTIYRLVASGDLPAVRVGERLRFRPDELDRYLERDREASP